MKMNTVEQRFMANPAKRVVEDLFRVKGSLHGSNEFQCCQVAEIPAKKLKRGRRKNKLAERICGRILADFTK
jgi:hypothetical protein